MAATGAWTCIVDLVHNTLWLPCLVFYFLLLLDDLEMQQPFGPSNLVLSSSIIVIHVSLQEEVLEMLVYKSTFCQQWFRTEF